jgi:Tfp pilus assembly PilM family ATPase
MRRTVTGVDLGRDSIKAVEVEIDGAAAQIVRSVSIPRVRLEGQEPESVAAALAEGMADAGISFNGVTLGLGGEEAILRYNHVPPMPPARLGLIMKYEVESVADRMGEVLAHDFKQLPVVRDDGERTVLLGLAREEGLSAILEALEAEGILVASAVPAPLAIYGAWELVSTKADLDSPDDDLVLIADLGRSSLDVALVLNNRLVFARSTTFGGDQFTEALAQDLGAELGQAEVVKKQRGGITEDAKGVDDRTIRPLRTAAGQLLGMLESSIRVGGSQAGVKLPGVTRLWFSGGGMRLKGLPRYLSTGLGKIPFEVFDPAGASDEDDSGSYTTGLGLSTIGLQRDRSGDRDVLLNILPQRYSDRQTFRDRTRFLIVAATLLVLLLCGKLADGYIRGSNANKTLDGLDKQFQTLQKLSGEKAASVAESTQARGRINRLLREAEPTAFQAFVLDYLAVHLRSEVQLELVDLDVTPEEAEDGSIDNTYRLIIRGRANNEKRKGHDWVLDLQSELKKQPRVRDVFFGKRPRADTAAWYSFEMIIEPQYVSI